MKKSSFVAMILGTIGGILFALGIGMCLTMVWSNMVLGVLIGIAGIVVLLCLIPFIKGLKHETKNDSGGAGDHGWENPRVCIEKKEKSKRQYRTENGWMVQCKAGEHMAEIEIGNLKLNRAVIQRGMGIGVSRSRLAGAVAKEGGMGVISTAQVGYDDSGFNGFRR